MAAVWKDDAGDIDGRHGDDDANGNGRRGRGAACKLCVCTPQWTSTRPGWPLVPCQGPWCRFVWRWRGCRWAGPQRTVLHGTALYAAHAPLWATLDAGHTPSMCPCRPWPGCCSLAVPVLCTLECAAADAHTPPCLQLFPLPLSLSPKSGPVPLSCLLLRARRWPAAGAWLSFSLTHSLTHDTHTTRSPTCLVVFLLPLLSPSRLAPLPSDASFRSSTCLAHAPQSALEQPRQPPSLYANAL